MVLTDKGCSEFIRMLGSGSPTPGGGGASALAGAVGVALGNMVGSLTTGKRKYAAAETDIRKAMSRAEVLRDQLLELVERDAAVFGPLAEAYGLPAETEEEKQQKNKVMETCLRQACSVPFEIMSKCCEAIILQKDFAEKGSRLAVSDAGTGAAICRAALEGAYMNVLANTVLMKDRGYAEKTEAAAEKMLDEYGKMADGIFGYVEETMKKKVR